MTTTQLAPPRLVQPAVTLPAAQCRRRRRRRRRPCGLYLCHSRIRALCPRDALPGCADLPAEFARLEDRARRPEPMDRSRQLRQGVWRPSVPERTSELGRVHRGHGPTPDRDRPRPRGARSTASFPVASSFRVLFYLPVVTSWVVVSLLFQYMFSSGDGAANAVVVDFLHVFPDNVSWFQGRWTAFVAICIAGHLERNRLVDDDLPRRTDRGSRRSCTRQPPSTGQTRPNDSDMSRCPSIRSGWVELKGGLIIIISMGTT